MLPTSRVGLVPSCAREWDTTLSLIRILENRPSFFEILFSLQKKQHTTNFHGWRRTGGEPGKNRGRPKESGENRGHLGREPGENRGPGYVFTKSTRGEAGALGQEPGEKRGEGIFFETADPTRDLKINEQDRP